MRFYTRQHRFYCGIDLHARLLAICIVDEAGTVILRKQIPDDKQLLREVLAPYRPDVAVAVPAAGPGSAVAAPHRQVALPATAVAQPATLLIFPRPVRPSRRPN